MERRVIVDELDQKLLLDQLCDRFEDALGRSGPPLTVQKFLEDHTDWRQGFADASSLKDFESRLRDELNWILADVLARPPQLPRDQDGEVALGITHGYSEVAEVHAEDSQDIHCRQCGRLISLADAGESEALCPQCGHPSYVDESDSADAPTGAATYDLPSRFDTRGRLGEGAYGIVMLAFDSRLKRRVAIKIPKLERVSKDLLLREARAASRLRHPNIVRIYDVGDYGQLTFIVCDYIAGMTLGQWAVKHSIGVKTTCELIIKIGNAIDYAHSEGVIHRDLKPGNIMIDGHGEPFVLDFGLSHSRRAKFESIAKRGSPIGTPAFMAPEQVRGDVDNIDAWTDVYGLGVVLYFLLTGTLPFCGASEDIYREIETKDPVSPRARTPSIPPALNAIVMKAMAKQPAGRYPTVRDFVADLKRFVGGQRVQAYPHYDTRVLKTIARKLTPLATVSGLTVGLLFLVAWWFSSNQGQHATVATMLHTDPPHAQLTWIPLDAEAGRLLGDSAHQSTGGEIIRLKPGTYKVIARTETEYFEVYRRVPQRGQAPIGALLGVSQPNHLWWEWIGSQAHLMPITIIPAQDVSGSMTFVPGGQLQFPDYPNVPRLIAGKQETVGAFLIDPRETTVQQWRSALPGVEGFDGQSAEDPVHSVSYDLALVYAERTGKNIPDLWEFLFAATHGGQTKLPWGDQEIPLDEWPDFDVTGTQPPIYDLVSGLAEWTETPAEPILVGPAGNEQHMTFLTGHENKHYVMGLSPSERERTTRGANTFAPPFFRTDVSRQSDFVGLRCVRRLPRQSATP